MSTINWFCNGTSGLDTDWTVVLFLLLSCVEDACCDLRNSIIAVGLDSQFWPQIAWGFSGMIDQEF